jgi:hypothetical protein
LGPRAAGKIIQGKLTDEKVYVQDNELTLSRNAVVAAETRAILDLNHDFMLKQMVGTNLDVTKLLATKVAGAMPPLPPRPGGTRGPDGSEA